MIRDSGGVPFPPVQTGRVRERHAENVGTGAVAERQFPVVLDGGMSTALESAATA